MHGTATLAAGSCRVWPLQTTVETNKGGWCSVQFRKMPRSFQEWFVNRLRVVFIAGRDERYHCVLRFLGHHNEDIAPFTRH